MSTKTVARNRKATHEYHIIDTYEAGIVLAGPEVKSIRGGRVSLAEAFARIEGMEAILYGMHVTPYDPASRWNVDPTRPRKLLLNRREIRRLIGATQQEGFTLVPLELYLKDGFVKLALALGQGKKRFDKREDMKRRDADREIQRALRRD
ncbi:MAG: SsrA-binding protein SmpB [Gemmatimonadota bacterium]